MAGCPANNRAACRGTRQNCAASILSHLKDMHDFIPRLFRLNLDDVVLGRIQVKLQAWSHDYHLGTIPRWSWGRVRLLA